MTKAMWPLALLLSIAGATHAADEVLEGSAGHPLRPQSECLDPTQARSWAIVDTDSVVVDAGRRKFLLRFGASCPELEWTTRLQFRTPGGSGRVCGHAFDAVMPESRGGIVVPCAIKSITSIDAGRYRELTSKRSGEAEGDASEK